MPGAPRSPPAAAGAAQRSASPAAGSSTPPPLHAQRNGTGTPRTPALEADDEHEPRTPHGNQGAGSAAFTPARSLRSVDSSQTLFGHASILTSSSSSSDSDNVHFDAATYPSRLRAALGSEDGSDDEADARNGAAGSDDEEEESFQYPHPPPAGDASELPERSLRSSTAFSTASSRRSSTLGRLGEHPHRPSAYPVLSRLRASALEPDAAGGRRSTAPSRASSYSASMPSSSAHGLAPPSLAALRSSSRTSIASQPSKRVRSFPYGPGARLASHAEAGTNERGVNGNDGDGAVASASTHSLPSVRPGAPFRWAVLTVPDTDAEPRRRRGTALAVRGGRVARGNDAGLVELCPVTGARRAEEVLRIGKGEASPYGVVSALAFSSDHTFIAVGHDTGHILLFDLARPATPARHVPPVEAAAVRAGRKEGHLVGSRILHLGFVGARHTAIVSADEHGLSFFHALGKILGVSSNDTLRILGRYPDVPPSPHEKDASDEAPALPTPRPPPSRRSIVLAMAPLPLGPSAHFADQFQFVALLTPAKLVVVGLKPTARTWYRRLAPMPDRSSADVATPSEVASPSSPAPPDAAAAETVVSGVLAWFPAAPTSAGAPSSVPSGETEPVLAYSFGRQLFFLRLLGKIRVADRSAGREPTYRNELEMREEQGYEHHEMIAALQWLSHEHLVLLDYAGSLSLFSLHARKCVSSHFLPQAIPPVVRHDFGAPLALKVAAGAAVRLAPFVSQSVQTHKGQVYLLAAHDVLVGTPLTWADHLLTLVAAGDVLSAIDLGTAYYNGAAPEGTLGLPEEREAQKQVVGVKVRELMRAAVQWAFSPERLTDSTHVTPDGRGVDRTHLFEGMARSCAEACLALQDLDFLFNDVYDAFAEAGIESLFVEQIEAYIVSGRIRTLPVAVVQRLVRFRKSREEYELAERVIWHVDPACLDLDQALSLCLERGLFDALIYVYTAALQDYLSPVIELLAVLRRVLDRAEEAEPETDRDEAMIEHEEVEVYKIFSYLSVALTGGAYPSQEPLPAEQALRAKSSLWTFLLSGRTVVWPDGPGGERIYTTHDRAEPTYPYLRLLLRFDSEALLDALDVSFEDAFLDDDDSSDCVVTRQMIVSVLLELIDEAAAGEAPSRLPQGAATFAQLFVARNAPKYPQFVKLSPAELRRLLTALAVNTDAASHEDRQLAVECLLSAFRPEHTEDLLETFEQAGFYRILQSAYRSAGRWDRLVTMIIRDASGAHDTFAQLQEVLSQASRRKDRSLYDEQLGPLIVDAAPQLVEANSQRAVQLVARFFPARHDAVLARLSDVKPLQLAYLQACLSPTEPEAGESHTAALDSQLGPESRSLFIALLAAQEPWSVVRNLDARPTDYFDLDDVAEVCEAEGCYDAVLWALDRAGKRQEAFESLDRVLATQALVLRADDAEDENGVLSADAQDAIEQTRLLTHMAVRLCTESAASQAGESWFRVLRSLVGLVHSVASTAIEAEAGARSSAALVFARELVQETLVALISSDAAEHISPPALFRRLVDDGEAQGRYYAEVRSVVDGLMSAYRLRVDVLGLTHRLVERDVYGALSDLAGKRRRGWRPASAAARCQGCNLALFGAAAAADAARPDTAEARLPLSAEQMSRSLSAPSTPLRPELMRRKSSLASELPAARPASPFLQPAVSPRPDKGKGVARPIGYDTDEGPAADGYFAPTPLAPMSPPDEDAARTPGASWTTPPRFEISNGRADETSYSLAEEEEERDEAILLLAGGQGWHRRCAPAALLSA